MVLKFNYKKKHKGVVGFEYIIILTIMSTALYGTYGTLSGSLKNKGNDISEFINNNGQNSLNGETNSSNGSSNAGSNNINNNNDKNTSKNENKDKDNNKEKPQEKDRLLSDSIKCIDPDYNNKYIDYDFDNDNNERYLMDYYISKMSYKNLIKYMKENNFTYICVWNEFPNLYDGTIDIIKGGHISNVYVYNKITNQTETIWFWNLSYTYPKVPGNKKITLKELEENYAYIGE